MDIDGYAKQIIWGTSLEMTSDDEIRDCYLFIRDYLEKHISGFGLCENAKGMKKIEPKRQLLGPSYNIGAGTEWLCGTIYSSSHLCNKKKSIDTEELKKEIENMVPEEKDMNFKNILSAFKRLGYISVYSCGRIFLID